MWSATPFKWDLYTILHNTGVGYVEARAIRKGTVSFSVRGGGSIYRASLLECLRSCC